MITLWAQAFLPIARMGHGLALILYIHMECVGSGWSAGDDPGKFLLGVFTRTKRSDQLAPACAVEGEVDDRRRTLKLVNVDELLPAAWSEWIVLPGL